MPLIVSQIPIKFGNNKKHIDLFEAKWYNIFRDEIWVLPLFSYQLNVTTNQNSCNANVTKVEAYPTNYGYILINMVVI